jgi:hypothetical protein
VIVWRLEAVVAEGSVGGSDRTRVGFPPPRCSEMTIAAAAERGAAAST